MGDDGVGIHIVNEMVRHNLSDHVEIIDGGTAGIDLVEILSEYKRVIVVDAIRNKGNSPSKIRLVSPADLVLKDDGDYFSLHDMELTSALRLMKTLNMDIPDITIIGIPADTIVPGVELSEECRRRVPKAVELILNMQKLPFLSPSPLVGEGRVGGKGEGEHDCL